MTTRILLTLCALAALNCGIMEHAEPDTADATDEAAADASDIRFDVDAICIGRDLDLCLTPVLITDDHWLAGENCTAETEQLVCPVGDLGSLRVATGNGGLVASFSAEEAVAVQGLALVGELELEGATSWISNGFQSWSQSGIIEIGPDPGLESLVETAALTGDGEVLRTGESLSWFYTVAGGGPTSLMVGAHSAERFKPWVSIVAAESGDLVVRAVSGGAGEMVALEPGDLLRGEVWAFDLGSEPQVLLETYGRSLEGHLADTDHRAEAGWNSWYELWNGVDEAAVRANATLAVALLAPQLADDAPPLRIVIDDGWQQLWGEWLPNDKFPSGMDGLAEDLRESGLTTGIWLAPLLVDEASSLVEDHPDWFVQGTAYYKPDAGRMMILDPTHPEAAEHIQEFVARIVDWGYDFLKIDFLFAGAYEGGRFESVTGLEAYGRALSLIREAAGEDVLLLAVGAPPHPSFPYVDAWRMGPDIALELIGPGFAFTANEARSMSVRWPLCWTVLCDADPPILRMLPEHEVYAGAWVAALGGGAFFLSDDLRDLDEERWSWGVDSGLLEAAISGQPFIPVDLFPSDPPDRLVNAMQDHFSGTNSHSVPQIWRGNGGQVLLNLSESALDIGSATVEGRSAVFLEDEQ